MELGNWTRILRECPVLLTAQHLSSTIIYVKTGQFIKDICPYIFRYFPHIYQPLIFIWFCTKLSSINGTYQDPHILPASRPTRKIMVLLESDLWSCSWRWHFLLEIPFPSPWYPTFSVFLFSYLSLASFASSFCTTQFQDSTQTHTYTNTCIYIDHACTQNFFKNFLPPSLPPSFHVSIHPSFLLSSFLLKQCFIRCSSGRP